MGIGVVNKPDKCKVKSVKGANHQSIANSSIPDLPDIIHPAADKEGEHLLDVEPEIVPETILSLLEEKKQLFIKGCLPVTSLAAPIVDHLKKTCFLGFEFPWSLGYNYNFSQ